MTEIDATTVFCSRCWAPPGHHCRTSGGINLTKPHRVRVKEAAEHQAAEDLLDKILREAES
jgi:hypothetical protein